MNNDLIETFSGVRGIWGQGLNKDLAIKYGLSFVGLLQQKLGRKPSLIIGCDTRVSSKEIAEIFKNAFSAGVEKIIDAGINPTPAVELGVREYQLDGGVMITASHSPQEFNGWKLLDNTGAIISSEFLKEIIAMNKMNKELGLTGLNSGTAEIIDKSEDLISRYIGFAHKIIGERGINAIKKSSFKIVVDPNGGAAIPVIEKLLSGLNIKGIYLNMDLGGFNRVIEPTSESLDYLREIIKHNNADFGIGFDCDADRAEVVIGQDCAFTKKHGPVVSGQYLLALSVDEILSGLSNSQGQTVVTNDCTSYLTRKAAEKYGARIEEVEVGEINVVKAMERENSPIGGEGSSSGAVFPPSKCRDGILTLVIILRHLALKNQSLCGVLDLCPDSFAAREKMQCRPDKQIEVRLNIKKILQGKNFKIQERGNETGTVKALISPDSFIFFRASKTEPGVFRVIADAPKKDSADELLKQGIAIFNKANAKTNEDYKG